MDISKINGQTPQGYVHTGRKSDGKMRFDEILNSALETVSRGDGAAEGAVRVPDAGLNTTSNGRPADHLMLRRGQKILDLLSQYCDGLGDPGVTLKRLEPVVLRIENELKELGMRFTDSPVQDEGLLRIVNEIAVRASVETLKFQRGDHIA